MAKRSSTSAEDSIRGFSRELLAGFFGRATTTRKTGSAVIVAIGIKHFAIAVETVHFDFEALRVLLPEQHKLITNTDGFLARKRGLTPLPFDVDDHDRRFIGQAVIFQPELIARVRRPPWRAFMKLAHDADVP